LTSQEAMVHNFSACPLCGYFLASLMALLGDESLSEAGDGDNDPWLKFEWQSPMTEMLAKYYDWQLMPNTELHTNRCPLCRRRMVYEETEEGIWLYVERQPGSRA
jgi:hypothetical protein